MGDTLREWLHAIDIYNGNLVRRERSPVARAPSPYCVSVPSVSADCVSVFLALASDPCVRIVMHHTTGK